MLARKIQGSRQSNKSQSLFTLCNIREIFLIESCARACSYAKASAALRMRDAMAWHHSEIKWSNVCESKIARTTQTYAGERRLMMLVMFVAACLRVRAIDDHKWNCGRNKSQSVHQIYTAVDVWCSLVDCSVHLSVCESLGRFFFFSSVFFFAFWSASASRLHILRR